MKNTDKPAYPIWTEDMPIEGDSGLSKLEWMAGQVSEEDIEAALLEAAMQIRDETRDTSSSDNFRRMYRIRIRARTLAAEAILKECERREQ